MTISIERIGPDAPDAIVDRLATLLEDAIDSGATVSFLGGLTHADATAWWRSVLVGLPPRSIVLIARDGEDIVGTVQMHPAWAPNQPHRGEVAKLLVQRRARRHGIGRALMHDLERRAREDGFRLLMLNTRQGDPAERLYASLGWARIGEVPDYALDPAGVPHATVLFYKQLAM
jgi:GNAT superfamily N-acetyltransferase